MDAPLRNEAARGGHIQYLSSTCLATNGKWHYKGGASPVCGQLRADTYSQRWRLQYVRKRAIDRPNRDGTSAARQTIRDHLVL